jgi:acyl-CoA thioester hydrolase
MEEAATRASASVGFSREWYFSQRRAWVVRDLSVRYLSPLQYGEQVEMRTWVSDFRRIYSHREYDLRRISDGSPVLRGRARWVYIDLDSMRAVRIPAEFEAAFDPSGEAEDLGVHLKHATALTDNPPFISTRQVQHYELDSAGHVNNSVYLNWFEQAMFGAMNRVGWTPERLIEDGTGMVQAAHDVKYLLPALDGMPLEITSRPIEIARVRGVWLHEIRHATTGDVLARDYSVGAFFDLATGRPKHLPEAMIEALLAGPTA